MNARRSYRAGNNYRVVHCNYEPAMTFEAIAQKLGSSRKSVFVVYARAMEKIRQRCLCNPKLYDELAGLIAMRTRRPAILPDWSDE